MPFTVPIDQLTAQVSTRLTARSRSITKELFTRIVMRTPVFTGRARANWNVSVGAPNLSYTHETSLGRAQAELAKIDQLPIGSNVFLANGLPYARLLEYGGYPNPPKRPTGKTVNGFSTQAPAGMIRVSIAEMIRR